MSAPATKPETWPALPLEDWEETRATLHMWTQIVGKVRLAQTPSSQSLVECTAVCLSPWFDDYCDGL
jgi:hypothetical protein